MVGRVGAPPSADRGAASPRSSLGPHQKQALQGRSVLDDLWSDRTRPGAHVRDMTVSYVGREVDTPLWAVGFHAPDGTWEQDPE